MTQPVAQSGISRVLSTQPSNTEEITPEEEKKRKKGKDRSKSPRGAKYEVPRRLLPKMKTVSSSDRTLLPLEETLRDRWFIKGIIGHGGYGDVYLALDMKQAEEVAIKVEPKKRKGKLAKRMLLEQKVLLALQGKPHVPKMLASGHDEKMNFIAMQLLSVNIGDLKKASPVRRLSRTTTGRIVQQSIAALRDMHNIGYLHRDVKPANMCFGIQAHTRHVLMLVDFGMVRRFKNADGTLRAHRGKAGFRGTLRYVSTRVHDRVEQCPCDDLVSVVYSALELMVGDLPWKNMSKNEDVRAVKMEMQSVEQDPFLLLAPPPFQNFCKAVFGLAEDEEPHYAALQDVLKDMIGDKRMSDPYDWETEYAEALEGSTYSASASVE